MDDVCFSTIKRGLCSIFIHFGGRTDVEIWKNRYNVQHVIYGINFMFFFTVSFTVQERKKWKLMTKYINIDTHDRNSTQK